MRHPCATIADGLEAMAMLWEAEQPLPPSATEDMDLNRVHNQGWLEGQRAGIQSLRNWVAHLRLVATQRFPWCDTCKLPAVSSESLGRLHSVPGNRFGLHPELDKSGHEVTIREWFDVATSDLTA